MGTRRMYGGTKNVSLFERRKKYSIIKSSYNDDDNNNNNNNYFEGLGEL